MCIRNARIISSKIKSVVRKNNVFLVFITVFYPRTYVYGALFYCVYYCGDKCKTKNIYKKIYRVGHERIYSREYGKSAGLEGADVEHIEADAGVCIVHYDVKYKGYRGKRCENSNRPGEEALVELVAVMRGKEDAERELEAVVYHCLNIDACCRRENVTRIYHYDETRKKRKRHHISADCIAEFALLCKNKNG